MRLFQITENDASQRLDKFLRKLFPNATRSLIYKFNRKGKIKILSTDTYWKFIKKDNEYKLQVWDQIKIFLSESDFSILAASQTLEGHNISHDSTEDNLPSHPSPLGSTLSQRERRIQTRYKETLNKKDIVYEDGDLLVINKNPHINVHPWDYKTKESNLISQVHDYLWESLNSLTFKPSLIHRIDRDTSGIIMIWKKKDILTKLVSDFKHPLSPRLGPQARNGMKRVKKTYYTIILWKLSRKSWTIKKKLKRIENPKNENKVQIHPKWQEAITHYKLLAEHKIETKQGDVFISEVEVNIETWRMHQIRVHLSSIGNPIIWDKSYWDKRLNSFFSKNFWLSRQALHAWKIEFFHYARKRQIKLEARIKKDLSDFINKIKDE